MPLACNNDLNFVSNIPTTLNPSHMRLLTSAVPKKLIYSVNVSRLMEINFPQYACKKLIFSIQHHSRHPCRRRNHQHHHHHHHKWLYSPLLGFDRFFRFLILYTVSKTPWMEGSARQVSTHTQTAQTEYASKYIDIHASSEIRTPRSQCLTERRLFVP
jgi:hypothetical protein